jgi:hypothetical protein
MTTVVAPDRESDQSETERPTTRGRDLADAARQEPDPPSSDPTQGRKIGADPYDDPTQGRKIGADPYDDPTQGRKTGADPDDDPTRGIRTGSKPYDDPTQRRKIGSDPYDDPTRGRRPERRSTTVRARLINATRR